jgi:hypothetical protein
MPTLHVTKEQLSLIQNALEFYARVGLGQMWVIKEHPTFENTLMNKLRPKKELEVGDKTERGVIVEIGDDYVKTEGNWGNGTEVKQWPKEQIKLSVDYSNYHDIRDIGDKMLSEARNMLLQIDTPNNGSFGIMNENVDESCREAYDIMQVIRHEFWKSRPDRDELVVSSHVNLSSKDGDKIKVEL